MFERKCHNSSAAKSPTCLPTIVMLISISVATAYLMAGDALSNESDQMVAIIGGDFAIACAVQRGGCTTSLLHSPALDLWTALRQRAGVPRMAMGGR